MNFRKIFRTFYDYEIYENELYFERLTFVTIWNFLAEKIL